MDLLMRFLEFTAKEMSPPKAYGTFHLLFWSIGLLLSFLIAFLLRKTKEKADKYLLFGIGIFLWQTPNLAAGGVYMAYRVTAVSVSSYLAFPSLQSKALRFISVALSLKSPSPDVIRHPVLCCSDFPHDPEGPRDRITNSNPYIL